MRESLIKPSNLHPSASKARPPRPHCDPLASPHQIFSVPSPLLYVVYITIISAHLLIKGCTHWQSTTVPQEQRDLDTTKANFPFFNLPSTCGAYQLFGLLQGMGYFVLNMLVLSTTQFMPPGDPQVVPRGGRFIGSSSGAFLDQLAADIYLQNIWTTQGRVRRIGVACVGWGLSVGMIQEADSLIPGRPGDWFTRPLLRHLLRVEDPGPQVMGVAPVALPNTTPPGEGVFIVNNHVVIGPKLPWHHRLKLRVQIPAVFGHPAPDDEPVQLHYHKHKPRKDHGPEPPEILPKIKGKHYIFDEVIYSTQIQNCRRAKPDSDDEQN